MAKALVLTLEGTGERRELPEGRNLSVGRTRENDWALAEAWPNPTVSRRHCRFAVGPEGATVTDLGSTNGTRVDGQAIAAHSPTPLLGGEKLEIGAHRLLVQVVEARSPASTAMPLLGPAGKPAETGGPDLLPHPPWPEAHANFQDAAGPAEQEAGATFGLSDLGSGLFSGGDASEPPGGVHQDPLAGSYRPELQPLPQGGGRASASRGSPPNGGAPQHEAMLPPLEPRRYDVSAMGGREPPSRHPDLAKDPLGSVAAPRPRPEAPQAEGSREDTGRSSVAEEDPFGFGSPDPRPPTPEPVLPPGSRRSLHGSGSGGGRSRAPADVPPRPDLRSAAGEADGSPAGATGAPTGAPTGTHGAAPLAAFLGGAGLPASFAEGKDPEAFLRDAGRVFAHLADGLRELLAVRAIIKDQAGLDRTQISASLNNALKLSVNGREATAALLGGREEGYLSPVAAVDAGFRDLKTHELAVLDGIRSAIEELLDRFNPTLLEQRLEDAGMLATLIHGGRRAQLWELYQERYGDIAQSARTRFLGRLDEAFRAAYARRSAQPPAHGERPPDLPPGGPRQ